MGTRRRMERALRHKNTLVLVPCPDYKDAEDLFLRLRHHNKCCGVLFWRLDRTTGKMYEDVGLGVSSRFSGKHLKFIYIVTDDGMIFRRHYAQVKCDV